MKTPVKASTLLLPKEELANIVTHAFGFILFIVASPILLAIGLKTGSWQQVVGLGIFCFTLLIVYASSTVYHSLIDQRLKHFFQIVDHICIYFLIAGTHTPLVLIYLDRPLGWIFLAGLWLMVLIGILFKIFFFGRFKRLSLLLYILMGWSGLLVLPQMISQMSTLVFYCIFAGGFSYTTGVFFFVSRKIPYHHAIWHVFVIGGSFAHFLAMVYCFI